MKSDALSVEDYLAGLPADRRSVLITVRETILTHLPPGYVEGMQCGMIGYAVPRTLYPAGYHADPRQPLPFAALAAQKNHFALYLMCVYGNDAQRKWFESAWRATGRKLDMGKACIRFKSLDDIPLEVIGEALARVPVDRFIAGYEAALQRSQGLRRDEVQKTSRAGPARKR